MLATWITLARLPLLGACLAILYLGSPPVRLVGVALLFVGLLLDTVDGLVARARSETSLMGSVLDIAADRTYELSLWVTFAYLGLVPAVIPLIVLARTTLTDALRGVGVAEGTAPFEQQRSSSRALPRRLALDADGILFGEGLLLLRPRARPRLPRLPRRVRPAGHRSGPSGRCERVGLGHRAILRRTGCARDRGRGGPGTRPEPRSAATGSLIFRRR